MGVWIGACILILGIMGGLVIAGGIWIHNAIRRRARYKIKRIFSVKHIKGRGYRLIGIPHRGI